MKEDFSFILDGITFSYSSLSTFNNCRYCFKLTYINAEEREQNAFAEFGLLIHDCLEKYFNREASTWDLPKYYEENFGNFVQSSFPPYPKGMRDNYYADGLTFFENITFNIDDFDVIMVEEAIHHKYKDIDLVIKPDAIIKEKSTNKTILLDFKTSKLYGNKKDKEKIDEYMKQMYLYAYVMWLAKNIVIDEIWIWFIRNQKMKKFAVNEDRTITMIDWLENTYSSIMSEELWLPNTDKSNKYFCDHICSMRNICNKE